MVEVVQSEAEKSLENGTQGDGLRVRGLVSGYGNIAVVKGISFDLPKGSVLAIVGPNGAGKTTLVKTITGLIHPQSGSIDMNGKSILRMPTYKIARSHLLLVPEGRDIFTELTVWENLKVAFDNLNSGDVEHESFVQIYELFPILAERRNQIAGNLSGGQQQMLAVARALLGRPEILILDEPSLGLAGIVIKEIYSTFDRLRQDGLTILLVEQNANLAMGFADHTVVLVNGRIVMKGTSTDLRANPNLVKHYLGGT